MGGGHSKEAENPEDLADLWSITRYTMEELQEWYDAFVSAHPQKFISTEEFVEVYSRHYSHREATLFAQSFFRLFDLDNNGRIDFRELVIVLGSVSTGSSDEKLNWMFSLFDIDRDGFIKKHEMRIIFKSLINLSPETKFVTSTDAEIQSQVDEVYAELDKNFDGLLSRQEFLQLGNTNMIFMDVFEKAVAKIGR